MQARDLSDPSTPESRAAVEIVRALGLSVPEVVVYFHLRRTLLDAAEAITPDADLSRPSRQSRQ